MRCSGASHLSVARRKSDRPGLSIAGGNGDDRPFCPGDELQTDRNDLALDDQRIGRSGDDAGSQLAVDEAEELQLPRIAVDYQQFADADAGVEINLLAALITTAGDFDGKIRSAKPMREAIFGFVAIKENQDIGAAIVAGPIIVLIRNVRAGLNPAQTPIFNQVAKDDRQFCLNI